jgi:ribosomal protein S27AE
MIQYCTDAPTARKAVSLPSYSLLTIYTSNAIMIGMLEAKCPRCGKKAQVNEHMTEVRCKHCDFIASYDEYIEIMKGKAVDIADSFQTSWDRNPF